MDFENHFTVRIGTSDFIQEFECHMVKMFQLYRAFKEEYRYYTICTECVCFFFKEL